jgi:hypothetical protein
MIEFAFEITGKRKNRVFSTGFKYGFLPHHWHAGNAYTTGVPRRLVPNSISHCSVLASWSFQVLFVVGFSDEFILRQLSSTLLLYQGSNTCLGYAICTNCKFVVSLG